MKKIQFSVTVNRLYIKHMKPIQLKKLPVKKAVEKIAKKIIRMTGVAKNTAATKAPMVQDFATGHRISAKKTIWLLIKR